MPSGLRKAAKRLFMRLPYIGAAHFLTALPLIRLEMERHPDAVRFETRFEMYAWLANRFTAVTVQYLEFGVWEGTSIREWARILPTAENRFVGFDSFEGLPEDWEHAFATTKKGTFATGGKLPEIDDPRVSFVKGWFSDTLPSFARALELGQKQLVIHLDADLYSSTSFVLHELKNVMVPGTVLIFDEFGSPLHEYRALKDWAVTCGRRYRIECYVRDTVDQAALTLL